MGYNRLGNELSVINSFRASTDDVQVGPYVQGNYIITENTACACAGIVQVIILACWPNARLISVLVLHIEIHYCSMVALTVLKMMQVQPHAVM